MAEQQRTQQQTKTAQNVGAMPGTAGAGANAPAVRKPKLIERLAELYGVEPGKLAHTLKNTCFKGSKDGQTGLIREATDDELMALLIVAEQYGLNPFTKEIYAYYDFKRGGIVPVVSIDGWLRIVNEHPQFDGMEFEYTYGETGQIVEVVCTMYRKDRSKPIIVGELYAECVRSTEPWKGMPRRMLRHKAVKECGRYAFGFANLHDEEEAMSIIEGESARIDDVGNALTAGSGGGLAAMNADIKRQSAAAEKAKQARKGETFEAEKSPPPTQANTDQQTGEIQTTPAGLTFAYVMDAINAAKSSDELDAAATLIEEVADKKQQAELSSSASAARSKFEVE